MGPCVMDAIAPIFNHLESNEPDIPENCHHPLHRTKPPFRGMPRKAPWTQWRGSQIDPIKRNPDEVDGVDNPWISGPGRHLKGLSVFARLPTQFKED